MYTPSPSHENEVVEKIPEDDNGSKLSEDFSSSENRDVTEIDEELILGLRWNNSLSYFPIYIQNTQPFYLSEIMI